MLTCPICNIPYTLQNTIFEWQRRYRVQGRCFKSIPSLFLGTPLKWLHSWMNAQQHISWWKTLENKTQILKGQGSKWSGWCSFLPSHSPPTGVLNFGNLVTMAFEFLLSDFHTYLCFLKNKINFKNKDKIWVYTKPPYTNMKSIEIHRQIFDYIYVELTSQINFEARTEVDYSYTLLVKYFCLLSFSLIKLSLRLKVPVSVQKRMIQE